MHDVSIAVAAAPTTRPCTTRPVPSPAPADIWNFSDLVAPKGRLTQPEFFIALKLIALKQSGQNFAIKNISKPAKIPQLAGHTEVQ